MPKASRNEIYESTIRRMTTEAMETEEAQFRQADLTQLLELLKGEATRLGHSPWPREFAGGKTLLHHFSTWEEALTQAGLPMPTHPDKLTTFPRYRQEAERQKAVLRRKKVEKREKAQHRMLAQKNGGKENKKRK